MSTPLAEIVPFELPKPASDSWHGGEGELSAAFDIALDTLHDHGAFRDFRARLDAARGVKSVS